MQDFLKTQLVTLAMAACAAVTTQAGASPIFVDRTLTATPSNGFFTGNNASINFNFNNLPIAAKDGATVTLFVAYMDLDGNEPGENLTVAVDGDDFPAIGPFGANATGGTGASQSFSIPLDDLTDYVFDGSLQLRVGRGAGVQNQYSSAGTPTISASLHYELDTDARLLEVPVDAQIPEPTPLALMGLGVAGLMLSRRRLQSKVQ